MTAVVCGSFAYDNILNFEGKFEDHLISSELNNINLSFQYFYTSSRQLIEIHLNNILYHNMDYIS